MNGCLKCIHKPFCTLSACGAVCSSFKDKDRYADRNEVIREFAERAKEKMNNLARMEYGSDEIYFLIGKSFIDNLVKEMTEKHDQE